MRGNLFHFDGNFDWIVFLFHDGFQAVDLLNNIYYILIGAWKGDNQTRAKVHYIKQVLRRIRRTVRQVAQEGWSLKPPTATSLYQDGGGR